MTAGDLDLLRERRVQQGIPEPDTSDPLVPLLRGTILGGALVGLALLGTAFMAMLNRSTATEVERLTPVEARFDALQGRIKDERSQRLAIEKSSTDLAQALVAVRSGSALMEDLRRRAPRGVQFTEARVESNQLRLKGLATDPAAFTRINALQLELQRSPLFAPKKVKLVKANRDLSNTSQSLATIGASSPVNFELVAGFRPGGGIRDLATLRLLGADGAATRLQELRRKGVIW